MPELVTAIIGGGYVSCLIHAAYLVLTKFDPRPKGSATVKVPKDGFTDSELSMYFAKTAPTPSRTPTRDVPEPRRHATGGANKLKPGEIAGLVVGVVIGAVTIGIGVFWLLQKKKKAKGQMVTSSAPENTAHEMEDQDHAQSMRKWFLKGRWRHEVEGMVHAQELDSKNIHTVSGPPVELEATEWAREDVTVEETGRAERV